MTEIKDKQPAAITDPPQDQSALGASLDAGLSPHEDAPSDSDAGGSPEATDLSNPSPQPSSSAAAYLVPVENDLTDPADRASRSNGATDLFTADRHDDPYFNRHDDLRFDVAAASDSAPDAPSLGAEATSYTSFASFLESLLDPAFIGNAPSYVDPVLNQTPAYYWNNGNFGQAVTVSYAFPTSIPSVYAALANELPDQFRSPQGLTSTQRTYALQALNIWEEVANVDFVQASFPSSAQINFYTSRQGIVSGAFAFYPHQFDSLANDPDSLVRSAVQLGGDVWINRDSSVNTTPSPGGYGFMTLMHEIGHAIGLKHPGNYNATGGGTEAPYLPGSQDNNQYSIMSYWPHPQISSVYPVTPMLYDIAAIQFVYGANYNTRSGNTNYTFSTSTEIKAIWDGGGTDTFDASNQSSKVWISLIAGTYSSIGTGGSQLNNIAIAFGANIENATGGSAGDLITGNNLANVLSGMAGNDTLAGGLGNDMLIGGSGSDIYDLSLGGGGWGSDRIIDTDSSGAVIFSGVSGLSTLTRQFVTTVSGSDLILTYRSTGAELIFQGAASVSSWSFGYTPSAAYAGGSTSVTFDQIKFYNTASSIAVASNVLIAPVGWLRADYLPFAVTDADGDAAVSYRFTDVGTGSSSAFLWLSGVGNLAQGTTISVSASQLSSLWLGGGSANGPDMLRVEVYDGYDWSATAGISVATRGPNNLPVITAATTHFGLNETVDFSSVFNVSDADGDTIQQYRVTDATNGGSHLVLNGVQQADGAAIIVTAAQMQAGDLDILTSSVSRSVNQFQIQAHDAYGWSNAAAVNVTSLGPNAIPVVTATGNILVAPAGWLRADLLPLAVTDGDGDTAVAYRFTDVGTGSTSAFLWKGANLAQGSMVEVSASQLSSVYLGGGSTNGTDTLRVQVYDGYDWSTATDIAVSTRGPNSLPTITAGTTSFGLNQTLSFASVFNATDADGDTIQQYRVTDATNGGAHLILNGVQQADGTTITVTAAQMQAGDLDILTSSVSRSVNQFQIQAYDGYGWSNATTINVASVGANAVPVVTSLGNVLIAPSGWLRADLLPFAVTDGDGDTAVTYRFTDVGSGGTSAFLWKGANLAQGTTVEVSASQLSSLWLGGGSANGTDTLRMQVFDGYDWSAATDIAVATRGPNTLPVLTPATTAFGLNQTVDF